MGVILVVAAIVSAVVGSGIGGAITRGIRDAICSVGGEECDRGGGVTGRRADAVSRSSRRRATSAFRPRAVG